MQPTKAGTYYGKPVEWNVEEKNGKPQFVVRMALTHYFSDWKWLELKDTQITGYFYPVKNSGERNDAGCEMLSKALGWDGASFESLHNGNFGETYCQCEVRDDNYQGNNRLKLAWLNPHDYTPQPMKRTEPEKLKSLDERWGKALKGEKVLPSAVIPARPSVPAKPAAKDPADERLPWDGDEPAKDGIPI